MNILSLDQYTTISSVLPLLTIFKEMINQVISSESCTQLTRSILENAYYVYLLHQFTEDRKNLELCCLLDPIYKADYVDPEDETNCCRENQDGDVGRFSLTQRIKPVNSVQSVISARSVDSIQLVDRV